MRIKDLFSIEKQNPYRFITIGLIITLLIIVGMSWNIYRADRGAKAKLQQQITSEALRFELALYNDVLTTNTRIMAYTKNKKALQAYDNANLNMMKVLQRAYTFSNENNLQGIFNNLIGARRDLFIIETRANKLLKRNQIIAARKLLFGTRYDTAIKHYNHAILQLITATAPHQYWLETYNNLTLYGGMQRNALHLALLTHSPAWITLYQIYTVRIKNLLNEAENTDNNSIDTAILHAVKISCQKLDAKNQIILAAIKNKQYRKAEQFYHNQSYQILEQKLKSDILLAHNTAKQLTRNRIYKHERDIIFTLIQAAVILVVFVTIWLFLLRLIRYWQMRLIHANQKLDLKVEQRTEKLKQANTQLQQEIHERQLAEERKERLEKALKTNQKLQAVGTLAAGIAHDFNNLLAVILAHGEFLKNQLSDQQQQTALNSIIDTTNKAGHLTQQLLNFARKGQHQKQSININMIIKESIEMLRPNLPKNICLQTNLAQDLSPIQADSNQLLQVFINLGLNAKDAMTNGGEILISSQNTTLEETKHLQSSRLKPGNYVEIKIADQGCGIEQHVIDNIFDPFYTTKAIGKGTGLGLSSVYGIMRQHHGVIDVESKSGKGTVFSLYFKI